MPRTRTRSATPRKDRDALPAAIVARLAGDSVTECLWRRAHEGDEVAFWVETLDEPRVEVTVRQLLDGSEQTARGLVRHGLAAQQRAMIVLPTGADFLFSFWGALRVGATPVPAYPPVGLHQLDAFRERLARMAAVVDARLIVMPEMLRAVLLPALRDGAAAPPQGELFDGRQMITPEELSAAGDGAEKLPAPRFAGDDLALIQFSSGSTGDPRAVCLTHRNILANMRAFVSRLRMLVGDTCVSWLPLYHDMGLIGTMMGSLLSGTKLVMIPPTDFLRRPACWLEVMGRYRATLSVAPQFAYNLTVRKVDPESLPGVDLSPLRVVLNGAEPVDAAGVAAFQRRFRQLGLRPGVVTPCYGLAEGTLAATMRTPGQRVRTITLAASRNARAVSKVVCVGPELSSTEVRIRSPRGAWIGEGKIGEICLRGPAVTNRYLGARGAKTAVDRDGWLATGDLGFFDEGELFVTGRIKDLIIIGGRNLYPHEIEAAAAEVPGLRPGRIAAFGVTERNRATEVLVLLAEAADSAAAGATTAASLRQRLRARFGVVPHDIVLLPRGQVPVTTSGKLRRAQARADYERGAFHDALYRARSDAAVAPS
jgi:acyl-CoA synthetase (AMP-forming)/AMP-acid ligase II